MSTVRYFSMFSGIGGFELGLESAGENLGIDFQCVGYSEIDKHAIQTYERHFNHDNYGDATRIHPDSLPEFDLLVGGPPCQPFSIAGGRSGFDDTRGTLFFDVARIIAAREPEKFILENVRGLINHDKGKTFGTILRTFQELGYSLEWSVLDSANHGVPQHRERVYLVGHLGGTPAPQIFPTRRPCNPYTTVGKSTETAVARTLTAGGNSGGNHSGMTILRTPQGDRRLTPIEWERLHRFPDDWTAGVSDTQRYKQTGNAVSPPVVQYTAQRLYGEPK